MARCPNATLTVHPRGARHMIDPRRLLAATVAAYGEQATGRMYGEVLPVPAERVRDAGSGGIFVGDSFGLSCRELDRDGMQFSFPTTSPAQFDPPALQRTIERIVALGPRAVYATHFGRLGDLKRLAGDLHRLIEAHVALDVELDAQGLEAWLDATARNTTR